MHHESSFSDINGNFITPSQLTQKNNNNQKINDNLKSFYIITNQNKPLTTTNTLLPQGKFSTQSIKLNKPYNSNIRIHRSLSDSKYGNLQNEKYRKKFLNENNYKNNNKIINNKNITNNNLKNNINNKVDIKLVNDKNLTQKQLLNNNFFINKNELIEPFNLNKKILKTRNNNNKLNATTTTTSTLITTFTTTTTTISNSINKTILSPNTINQTTKNQIKNLQKIKKYCNKMKQKQLLTQSYHSRIGSLNEYQNNLTKNCCLKSSTSLLSLVCE